MIKQHKLPGVLIALVLCLLAEAGAAIVLDQFSFVTAGGLPESPQTRSAPDQYWVVAVRLRGTKQVAEEYVLKAFGLKRGDRISNDAVEQALDQVRKAYFKLGFIEVAISCSKEVEKGATSDQESRLSFDLAVVEGERYVIRRVEVSGNDQTYYEKVLRAAGLRPGDPYNPNAVGDWIEGLNRSKRFLPVTKDDIEVAVNRDRHFVDLVIHLKEIVR